MTKAANTLEAGDIILHDFTNEPVATVAKVEEVRGLYTITYTDGRQFPKVKPSFKFSVAA